MDFRDQVFIAVAENLSFSKAAETLFISQPAITKHIKELESKLNVALFERKSNKVFLTKAGELCYTRLKDIRQNYENMVFELGRLTDAFKGKLRLGASSTISQYILPGILAEFHKRYPQIDLHILNGNSLEMEQKLLAKEIDMALVENDSSQVDLRYSPWIKDELLLVCGSQSLYSKQRSLAISDLQQIPLVMRERGSGTLEVIEHELRKKALNLESLNIHIHLGSTEAIKNFLVNFDGLAILSQQAIQKELRLKELSIVKIKGVNLLRELRSVTRLGPEASSVPLFKSFINSYNL